jgi:hypothetical protein
MYVFPDTISKIAALDVDAIWAASGGHGCVPLRHRAHAVRSERRNRPRSFGDNFAH